MPEGPEVRRAADKIADVLEGQNIEAVRFGMPRLRHYSRQLRGHRVSSIETRGKALLIHFEQGGTASIRITSSMVCGGFVRATNYRNPVAP